jgi:hypothetical protein
MTQSDLAERFFETQNKGKVKLNLKKGRTYNTSVLAKILKAIQIYRSLSFSYNHSELTL